nr:hypothetical protein [Tanacetum cinerariifolium]
PAGLHKKKQNDIRSNYLSGLYDTISRGERDGYEVGGGIILPMSFTGNPRYIADAVCRVFEQKIQALIAFLKEERIFRDVIGAELPDPRKDPEGYNVVSELMMHGPCEAVSLKAPCMKGEKCSKKFQKKFNQNTFFDENGHVHYKRRDTCVSGTRNEFQMEYAYKVSVQVHIERYRRVFARVARPIGESSTAATPSRQVIDEIQNYVEGCFICAHEAYWRILKFDIHHREPVVQILAVHLEDMQRVTFRDQDRKSWSPRKNSKSSIGRLAYVHPTSGELFFLRMLQCHQEGCMDFWEVQTINDIFYPTYRAACQALGLLGNDKEWEIAFEEACGSV